MSTISTKSRRKKQSSPQRETAPGKTTREIDLTTSGAEISERAWRLSALAILLVGAFLRLVKLSLVPLHHDEGVNGNFLVTLVREGKYFYDPQNYHGPTLYYFSAVIPWIVRFFGGKAAGDNYGLTTFNIRLVTVAFGVATIWLALLLRKRIGKIGALSAAALIAISPGAVYLSRYFIHESLFVFFTFGIVVAALKYYDTGRSVYLILASISTALMVATKETWIMNGPVLLIALVITGVYFRLRDTLDRRRVVDESSFRERLQTTIDRLGGPVHITTIALVAFAVFILVAVFFYSAFFTNYPKGVADALKTLNLWRQRTHEHEHPWYQYIDWLVLEEGVVVVLAGIGGLIAVWRADNRMALFLALWSFGLLAAYSLVGYKTPWISLNFIVPLALTSGYTLDVAYRKLREFQQARLLLIPAVLIVGICGYQLYQLNFVHYDDDQLPYVYAHTKRQMLTMLDEIDQIAQKNGTGTDTGIAIVSPDYWPAPWYFRDYKKVGYYGNLVPTNEPIIIGSMAQEEQLKTNYGDRYDRLNSGLDENGDYPLRPGVDLLLYVRRDVKR
ncbi:MAG TPA: flippase activity-associated protein Agl23 [Pyrinomonadaceae bacterium]|nr:flippase activity-associated protein Agl23 [Pyrinomonadaceae bacterium]